MLSCVLWCFPALNPLSQVSPVLPRSGDPEPDFEIPHPTVPWNHRNPEGAALLGPESATGGKPIKRVPTEGATQ